ncbi:AP-3 complex subunit sigma-1-like [Dromiciops gliroides]|uniref:AP-3 complex subunit sigma-1-like n=1 Tax=Dromiciops gliroides TaxID=33562 RepID=UPI001CC5133A|nr:AP-3 complex subunit sigma-1-like [Dromiciops gliroides]
MFKAIFVFNNHKELQQCEFTSPQVFVKTLDRCFENVCEQKLIFHNIVVKVVMAGLVWETNMNEIVTQIDAQNKLEKPKDSLIGAPVHTVSVINKNLLEIPRNIKMGDINIKVSKLLPHK